MGRNGKTLDPSQVELPLFKAPHVVFPPVCIRQPDNSILITAGRPVVMEEEIGTAEAAKILGMSQKWVEVECSLSRFKTAHKPGTRPKSRWKISRSEVLDRKTTISPE